MNWSGVQPLFENASMTEGVMGHMGTDDHLLVREGRRLTTGFVRASGMMLVLKKAVETGGNAYGTALSIHHLY